MIQEGLQRFAHHQYPCLRRLYTAAHCACTCGLDEWKAAALARLGHEQPAAAPVPALLAYMNATSGPERDAAYLRTYAERVRNGTEVSWEIPNTRARTLEDIATRIIERSSTTEISAGSRT